VNEPNIFAVGSYDQGISPPRRCSPPFCIIESTKGNSTFEPYLVVHHILLAHSSAVRLYRRTYRVYRLFFFSYCVLFCVFFGTVTLLSRDLLHCRRNKMDMLVSQYIHLGQFLKQIQRKTGLHVNELAIFIWAGELLTLKMVIIFYLLLLTAYFIAGLWNPCCTETIPIP
jgi:hypothetical protein